MQVKSYNCRMLPLEHSAILLTFIKPAFVIKISFLPIFQWLHKTGFAVTENPILSPSSCSHMRIYLHVGMPLVIVTIPCFPCRNTAITLNLLHSDCGQNTEHSLFLLCSVVRKLNDLWLGHFLVIFSPKCVNRNKSRLLFSSAEMFKKPLWQTVWTHQIRLIL